MPQRLPGKPDRPGTYLAKTTNRQAWFVAEVGLRDSGLLVVRTERLTRVGMTVMPLADFLPGVGVAWFGPVLGLDG